MRAMFRALYSAASHRQTMIQAAPGTELGCSTMRAPSSAAESGLDVKFAFDVNYVH